MHIIQTIAVAIIIDGPPDGAGSLLDWPTRLGQWISNLPSHLVALWHAAERLWWPWAPLLILSMVLGTVAVRLALAALWRRVAAGGYWVEITPTRTVDVARWGLVWRRLDELAEDAGGRWRLVRPPLAFEVWADGRGLRAGLWLPGWVSERVVAGEVARAWPGAAVNRTEPPAMDGAVAGVWLAADSYHPETGWQVDDPRPRTGLRRGVGADPDLGMVLAALADPGVEQVQRLLLQVLVRPAPGRRLGRLAAAARHPLEQSRGGVAAGFDGLLWLVRGLLRLVLEVLDIFLTSGRSNPSRASHARSGSAGRREPPDPLDREAMAEARAKHHDGPHLLATVRVGAVGGRRRNARQAAQSVAAGYREASRWLHPVRLGRARSALSLRRASPGQWLLLSANELGVLAHLPPDPALYRFDTAARHRAHPGGARRADPEAGWTRHGWTPDTERGGDPGDDDEFPEEEV
ncbi:hypothetical protein RB614_15800 [Phytohabitans sp. ZYX-F-186]|uniref:Uncharacterized protein n=1 Tax=Phytohabitans maris TaxID=3071409 RepID=A0ABU0ZHK0_9ACTN|nr:hypothetical protein [Phytohabitans sp. ZYX-F-186]MDQ7905976.1 hypothetical protein [Phytohabitans sp. ZYX-F-186]